MAIELRKLQEYLVDLRSVYAECVYNEKSTYELNKINTQIKLIEKLIEDHKDITEDNDRSAGT